LGKLFGKTPYDFVTGPSEAHNIAEPQVTRMFLPGNVLYFARNRTFVGSGPTDSEANLLGSEFAPMWVASGVLENEILITPSMILDHFPNRVGKVLREML
jgi:hypothetical protein